MSLLVPSKLWRSRAGGGVRRLLAERATLLAMEDWSGAPAMFDAATYPSLVVARKEPSKTVVDARLTVHRGQMEVPGRRLGQRFRWTTQPAHRGLHCHRMLERRSTASRSTAFRCPRPDLAWRHWE
jgi:hypothetical protein